MSSKKESASAVTLTVLGCGTMGIAILSGILSSLSELRTQQNSADSPSISTSANTLEEVPIRLPSRFVACVRRPESVKKIKTALSDHLNVLSIVQNDNVKAVSEADIVLLGCKPYMVKDILAVEGMKEALKGKLLISICAGLPVPQIQQAIYGEEKVGDPEKEGKCRVVRAMPSTASGIRESMTIIEESVPELPVERTSLMTWIFEQVGKVVYLPAKNMDASTALCGSGPAFFALMLEAAIDGAVAMGLPRAEAQRMAAQTMKGAAEMVLAGEHPALLREKVTTPGGCTMAGLLVLEEGTVRGTVARSVREATVVASQLGQGVQNVNGTRF